MFPKILSAVLLAAILILPLTGCSLRSMDDRLDILEDSIENRLDAAEDALEAAAAKPAQQNRDHAEIPGAAPSPAAVPAESDTQEFLTRQEAEDIALQHAGLTADQVDRLHTEYEVDDRVPHYEVKFHEGHMEHEYEIHAKTGQILSFEKDR